MQLIELYGFMTFSLFLFLLFDIISMRMEAEYFPFNKGAMGTYGPYTLLRSILVVVVYYLVADNPSIIGVEIPESLISQWPLIVSIVIPFLYLAIFKAIGGLVIKGVDVAAPIEGYMIKIRTEVTYYGREAAIERLYQKATMANPADPLDYVETCICEKASTFLKSTVADCMTQLAKSQAQTDALCVKRGKTGRNREMLVIHGWLAKIDMMANNEGLDKSVHHMILRMCS